jgi:hypothetical protein
VVVVVKVMAKLTCCFSWLFWQNSSAGPHPPKTHRCVLMLLMLLMMLMMLTMISLRCLAAAERL